MAGSYCTTTCKYVLLFLLTLVSNSCNYNITKSSVGNNTESFKELDKSVFISFALISNNVLSTCKDCHAGSKKPFFSEYAEVKTHIDAIFDEINTNSMPPKRRGYEPLNQCQKSLLQKWIDLGMPEVSTTALSEVTDCQSDSEPENKKEVLISIQDMPLNYQTLYTQIIQPKCISCHDDGGDAELYPFYPYSLIVDDILGSGAEWQSPAIESDVVRAVTADHDSKRLMPPQSSKLKRLTPEEVDFIIRWIDAGKPEH